MSSSSSAAEAGGHRTTSSSSSTTTVALFGFEALFGTLDVRSRGDALVAAIHWILVTDGLRSIAANDDDDDNDRARRAAAVRDDDAAGLSELLPVGWNEHMDDFYALRYVRLPRLRKSADDASPILIKMIFADGILIVSLLRPADNKTASVSLPLADYILDDFRNYATAFRNLDELQVRIETELLAPFSLLIDGVEVTGRNPDGSPGSREDRSTRREDDATYEERSNPPGGPYHRPDPLGCSFSDDDGPLVPPIGRGDLDPLGRGQGGMLMDPRHFPHSPLRPVPGGIGPERLPRGSVPPGARFDPFGPPIPDQDRRRNPRFAGPNPDHLPPPGYDDMFG